jgi:DNA repair photolyase
VARVSIRSRSGDAAPRGFRWPTLDDAAPALFPGLVERVPGTGEFRGMEFLHVEAKRIVNEVPSVARVPFRWTINAYRGCSHACSYCLSGDTPILMGDGRTLPIKDVRPGHIVYGTERRGSYRRYVLTEVRDQWSTVKPAYRVALEDGTELVASADHRFLTDRGWKHVIGAECGGLQRPHLTANNKLIGSGAFAASPPETDDYCLGYLTGMIRGDGHVGTYRYRRRHRDEEVHRFRLALVDDEALRRTRSYLQALAVETTEFVFSSATATRKAVNAIRTQRRSEVAIIRSVVAWPNTPTSQWCKGFLAGIFDAEGGHNRGVLRIANADPSILFWVGECLDRFGFNWVLEPARPNGVRNIRLRGGLRERLRFFHTVDPAISRKRSIEGTALKGDVPLGVVSVESLGIDLPMYDITTGTGDFVANGVVSHNCFARPTHEYLNLDAGEDFERKIVVKVNAVERLRADLHPRRWRGEPIAMGTNTDPYQRCEGRYRLTRGIVEVLSAARNPFSILTKSTLVLRDLDLLTEAARRTDVAVNVSIGSIDPDVWRLTEPGAPSPTMRVEAVARLRDAGLAPGVLLAPIIPGLSDSEGQLADVVRACVEAGAASITPLVLHLRPGVREHFLPRLEEHRPDLVERYLGLYRRSYAPGEFQRRIVARVHRLIERSGGTVAPPDDARPEAPGAPPLSATRQLSLGW